MGFEVGKEERHQELWDVTSISEKEAIEKPAAKKHPTDKKKHPVLTIIILTFIFIILGFLLTGILVAIG